MPLMLRSLWVVGTVGCAAGVSPENVRLRGASSAQDAAVRNEIADFEAWTGGDRIRLRSIEFVDLGDEQASYYESATTSRHSRRSSSCRSAEPPRMHCTRTSRRG
ncbi:MAG: hypothetical protein AAGA48_17545 [Myxococcota bacterium]